MENLLGLIFFLVIILSRLFGQKNPPPPKRQPRPQQNPQAPDRTTVQERPTVRTRPRPVSQKDAPQQTDLDDLFPIPDDIREIFGLPKAKRPAKEPEQEPVTVLSSQTPAEPLDYALKQQEYSQNKPVSGYDLGKGAQARPAVLPNGLLPDKSTAMQGIIWAEILHNPRVRRHGTYGRR